MLGYSSYKASSDGDIGCGGGNFQTTDDVWTTEGKQVSILMKHSCVELKCFITNPSGLFLRHVFFWSVNSAGIVDSAH
jgi:hypothetical protein